MPRKPRISDADAQLFRDTVADISPLRRPAERHVDGRRKRVTPPPRREPAPSAPYRDLPEAAPVGAEEALDFVRAGLQHTLLRRLRRGQCAIDGRLDLHGMTGAEAGLALERFIEHGVRARRRCVLVIHGKGYRSTTRHPVLKSQVNSWLRQRADVLAFCSAQPADGGNGAVYVLLKTRR